MLLAMILSPMIFSVPGCGVKSASSPTNKNAHYALRAGEVREFYPESVFTAVTAPEFVPELNIWRVTVICEQSSGGTAKGFELTAFSSTKPTFLAGDQVRLYLYEYWFTDSAGGELLVVESAK
ncbi:MAG: hypothetical protein KGJ89_04925 [Patescibacteria group bacterium]|nr:hypothetical protein [Patescibacteria group bacterium]